MPKMIGSKFPAAGWGSLLAVLGSLMPSELAAADQGPPDLSIGEVRELRRDWEAPSDCYGRRRRTCAIEQFLVCREFGIRDVCRDANVDPDFAWADERYPYAAEIEGVEPMERPTLVQYRLVHVATIGTPEDALLAIVEFDLRWCGVNAPESECLEWSEKYVGVWEPIGGLEMHIVAWGPR
jgi:hypothetical protein